MRRCVSASCAIFLAMSVMAGGDSMARAQATGEAASAGVRMVRLSAVRGNVELDRGTGRGFEFGFTNLPIVQGNRLRTQGLGWAEVEFEDGGSARITPDTQVDFNALGRSQDGQLLNTLVLRKGTLYVSRMKGDKSDLVVLAGGERMQLPPQSHVRVDVYPAGSELVVVKGVVQVEGEDGTVMLVDRSHALKFGGEGPPQLVKAKEEAPGLYDRWDAQAVAYHQALAGGAGSAFGTGNLSGVRDMQYYGNFADVDGCGRVWQPYLASASFDPAASGVWAWYPGTGYTFVSPYAWGWTAFNSGSWISCGAHGWGWQPGAWMGMKNHAIVERIHAPGHHPHPIAEPAPGKPTYVNAGDRGIIRSRVSVDAVSQFAPDSAGLGVARGSIGNLKQISKAVASGKSAPEPSFTGDAVAHDPLALTLLAVTSGIRLRPGESISGRGVELVRSEARPVAGPAVTGGRGGGYAGGSTSVTSFAVSSGGGNSGSGGAHSFASAAPISTSSAAGSARGPSGGSSGAHH